MIGRLWRTRQKPPPFTPAWAKGWAKRLYTLPAVAASDFRAAKLRRRGASVAADCFLAPCQVGGAARRLTVGSGTFVGRVRIEAEDKVSIGDCVCLNDGVLVLTATHDLIDSKWGTVRSPVRIDDYAWVAMGAILLPGVTVGRGAVVGAYAVVAKDVPPFAVAVGNPARVLPNRRTRDYDYRPTDFVSGVAAWVGPVRSGRES